MIGFGSRRDFGPIIVKPEGSSLLPKRIALDDKKLEEGWLQAFIRSNPEILPIAEIEPAFAPPISAGVEISTSAGSIDNLFLSPQGYLTIVETKLWRNPEARRQVVGQIIDYAKEISRWSFERLEAQIVKYNKKYRSQNIGLIDTIRLVEQVGEEDEADLVDAVSRNLRRGRFLLLIVGDGIRESVEEMVEFINQNPQLFFTLALIELQMYSLEDGGYGGLLVVPQVVSRTREITRAVVRVEGTAIQQVSVGIDTETEAQKTGQKRFTITEEAFFEKLGRSISDDDMEFVHRLIREMEENNCLIDWKQASFVVKMTDPGGSGQKLTLFVVEKTGRVYVGWLPNQLHSLGLPEKIAYDFVAESARLFKDCGVNAKDPSLWNRSVSISEFRPKYDGFSMLIQKLIESIRKESGE